MLEPRATAAALLARLHCLSATQRTWHEDAVGPVQGPGRSVELHGLSFRSPERESSWD